MKKVLRGSRIIKTGVAVLLTAWICELLGWPPVFAVITAIVTVEPTVSDSIKKGIVRFPASAIGSAYAVTFISLFGNSPITYTLAAVFTIATCFKLNLHAGLLVATLTSVAMVEVIHEHLFIAFLIRLGTTTIGLVVSTVVNMFIFPPDYREDISTNLERITKLTAKLINRVYLGTLEGKTDHKLKSIKLHGTLEKKLRTTDNLMKFQKDESKYHPLIASEKSLFLWTEKKAKILQRMQDNLDNVIHSPISDLNWTEEDRAKIQVAVQELAECLRQENKYSKDLHQQHKQTIQKLFWQSGTTIMSNKDSHQTTLPAELILLYELLALYNLVEQYFAIDQDIDKIST